MQKKTVSFGELYTKSGLNKKKLAEDTPMPPPASPGFDPLEAQGTLADAESTLPPTATTQEEEQQQASSSATAPQSEAPEVWDDSAASSSPASSFPELSPTLEADPGDAAAAPSDAAAPGDVASAAGDMTPSAAEERLRSMGVTSPQVPGANTLPDGRTVVAAQKQSLTLHEVTPECRSALSAPGFVDAVSRARANVSAVMRDQSAQALDNLRSSLGALGATRALAACEPGAAADVDAVLSSLTLWNDAQSRLADAQRAAQAAADNLQAQLGAVHDTQRTSGATLARLLPGVYKLLRKWEALSISLGAPTGLSQPPPAAPMPPAPPSDLRANPAFPPEQPPRAPEGAQ